MIQVQGLVKQFKQMPVLDGISFEIKKGEIFGYLGPNGAGKTTTMRIILGLLKPTSGSALVWGRSLGENTDFRKRVGILLERDGLYDRISAYENLDYYAQLYGLADRKRRIGELLELSGLAQRGGDKVGELSKGMKRRLALARAIIHEPEVLFLDEPSAGLDPEAQVVVRDLLTNLARQRGITIFLNSHDLDEVQRICSRVAIIHKGRIKVSGPVEELRAEVTPTVEFRLSPDADSARVKKVLGALDFVAGWKIEDARVTVSLSPGGEPSRLLRSLVEGGVSVEEARKVSRSLEDIYMEVIHQEEKGE